MKLNDMQIRGMKPKEKLFRKSDGGGLNIVIHPNGGKYWQLGISF